MLMEEKPVVEEKPVIEEKPVVLKKSLSIFVTLVSCFALWGLLNNMTDNLVPAFQKIFTMDQSRAGLVQVAFYGAYAVLAIFAAVLAEELSYRKGVLIGLGIYIAGALLYIPACIAQSFDIYFIAIFIVASGCSLLETTCNPYVLSLGDEETAVRRLNFAQMFNPVGSMIGIVLAQQLILSHLNPATADERAMMDPAALKSIINHELFWVCAPYVGLCLIAAAIWCFFFIKKEGETSPTKKAMAKIGISFLFSVVPMTVLYFIFPDMDKILWVLCGVLGPVVYIVLDKDYRSMLSTLLKTPRYWTGVIAQFFYVGVQIAAWTWMNAYCQKELGVTAAQGAIYYTIAISTFIACRWIATFAMKYFEPAKMMAIFALGAIIFTLGVVYIPTKVMFTIGSLPFSMNIICLILMSASMSLMFPTIYGMALGGLDQKAVKLGASGLIMSILGGAIITPWMANIIGNASSIWCKLVPAFDTAWDTNLKLTETSLRASFFVPAICFAVVLAYALIFSKKKGK